MSYQARLPRSFRQTLSGWMCGLATLIAATSGCASLTGGETGKWDWKNPFSRSKPKIKESQYDEPARVVAIWTPDVLTMPGKRPTRGFGGRLYFYNNRNETIPVDGQLVVYGFDDTDPDRGNTIPEKRFAFTPEQFTQHFSATDFGASYSIWIPWDDVQVEHKVISLVPVFTSASGHRVMGQQSLNALSGRKPPQQAKKRTKPQPEQWLENPVQSASFHQPQNATAMPWGPVTPEEQQRARRKSTTIEMPSSMAARSVFGVSSSAPSAENPAIARSLEALNELQRQNSVPPQSLPGTSQPSAGGGRYPGHPTPTEFKIRAGDPAGQRARFEHRELQAPALGGAPPIPDHAGWRQFPGEQPRSHPYSAQSALHP